MKSAAYTVILLFTIASADCPAVSVADIQETIDCASALSVIKNLSEENNNYQMVRTTKQLIMAHDRKMHALLDHYIKDRLSSNRNAILDVQKMTTQSFDVYKSKNLLEGSKYAKQVIEVNGCLSIENVYFSD